MDVSLKKICHTCEHLLSECNNPDFVCPDGVKEQVLSECKSCVYHPVCKLHIYNRFGCYKILEHYKNNILPGKSLEQLNVDIENNSGEKCPLFFCTDFQTIKEMCEIECSMNPPSDEVKSRLEKNGKTLEDAIQNFAHEYYMKQDFRGSLTGNKIDPSVCSHCNKNCGFISLEITELLKRDIFGHNK